MSKKFIKQDLINSVAEINEMSKAEAERQVSAVLRGIEYVVEGMGAGDKFVITGLFTMTVKEKPEAIKHNPKKPSEKVTVPAHNVVKIKAGKPLNELVNY